MCNITIYNSCMATLHVRNVPESLYDRLRLQAERQGRSLSAEVIMQLDGALGDVSDQAAVLAEIRRRRSFDPAAGSAPDSTNILRALRDADAPAYEAVLDEDLVAEARRAGRHTTDREALTAALKEYITRQRQRAVLELFGTIDDDPGYDYKDQRRRT